MKKIVVAAATALLACGTAHAAVTVTITQGAGAFAASGTTSGTDKIITFDYDNGQAGLPSGVSTSGISWNNDIKTGSSGSNWVAPTGDNTKYLRVETSTTGNQNGIDFANTTTQNPFFDTVSFYWGSVDTYNTVRIYGTGSNPIATFTGQQILDLAGITTSGTDSILVSFTNTEGALKKIGLSSTQNAFEVDNIRFSNGISGAVPEPATWAMMIVGFGAVGSSMRRRKVMKPSFV